MAITHIARILPLALIGFLLGNQSQAKDNSRYRLMDNSHECKPDTPNEECFDSAGKQNIASLLMRGEASLFADVSSNFGRIKNQDLRMDGLRIGLQDQGDTLISFAVMKNMTPVKIEDDEVDVWLAGLSFGGISNQNWIIDPYFSLFLGSGQIVVRNEKPSLDAPAREKSNFLFAAEPEIGLGVNLTSNFQLGVGLGYRIIRNTSLTQYRNADFQGWGANFHFLVGAF